MERRFGRYVPGGLMIRRPEFVPFTPTILCAALMIHCGSDDSNGPGNGGTGGASSGGASSGGAAGSSSGGASGGSAGTGAAAGSAGASGAGGQFVATCPGLPATAAMTDQDKTGINIASLKFDEFAVPVVCAVVSETASPRLLEMWHDTGSGKRSVDVAGFIETTSHGTINNAGVIPIVENLPADTDITVKFLDNDKSLATGTYDITFNIGSNDMATVSSATYTSK